jgi:predicted nucleic acid-binding protein
MIYALDTNIISYCLNRNDFIKNKIAAVLNIENNHEIWRPELFGDHI